jgi:hypothetical protein
MSKLTEMPLMQCQNSEPILPTFSDYGMQQLLFYCRLTVFQVST